MRIAKMKSDNKPHNQNLTFGKIIIKNVDKIPQDLKQAINSNPLFTQYADKFEKEGKDLMFEYKKFGSSDILYIKNIAKNGVSNFFDFITQPNKHKISKYNFPKFSEKNMKKVNALASIGY